MVNGAMVEPLDLHTVDRWAVDLVVKEGVLMNLNSTERVIAAWEMKQRGMSSVAIGLVLKTDQIGVEALWRRYERVGPRKKKSPVGVVT
jgi:hypothetical protein